MSPTSLSHQVRFPDVSNGGLSQDEEWCEVLDDGHWRRIRFHDYGEIYSIPGLYERIFYDALKCSSPQAVIGLLAEQLRAGELLCALDVGAGNGMVGDALADRGFGDIAGVDISPEAGDAVDRDRPGVYGDYYVCDLLNPPAGIRYELEHAHFGAMTSVAALGFGDVPPEVFGAAFELIGDGGWVAFTIKEDFLDDADRSGFADLIGDLLASGAIEEKGRRRYRHRLDVRGNALHYVAIAGVKHSG